jgi:hypothetical protein
VLQAVDTRHVRATTRIRFESGALRKSPRSRRVWGVAPLIASVAGIGRVRGGSRFNQTRPAPAGLVISRSTLLLSGLRSSYPALACRDK